MSLGWKISNNATARYIERESLDCFRFVKAMEHLFQCYSVYRERVWWGVCEMPYRGSRNHVLSHSSLHSSTSPIQSQIVTPILIPSVWFIIIGISYQNHNSWQSQKSSKWTNQTDPSLLRKGWLSSHSHTRSLTRTTNGQTWLLYPDIRFF